MSVTYWMQGAINQHSMFFESLRKVLHQTVSRI